MFLYIFVFSFFPHFVMSDDRTRAMGFCCVLFSPLRILSSRGWVPLAVCLHIFFYGTKDIVWLGPVSLIPGIDCYDN